MAGKCDVVFGTFFLKFLGFQLVGAAARGEAGDDKCEGDRPGLTHGSETVRTMIRVGSEGEDATCHTHRAAGGEAQSGHPPSCG